METPFESERTMPCTGSPPHTDELGSRSSPYFSAGKRMHAVQKIDGRPAISRPQTHLQGYKRNAEAHLRGVRTLSDNLHISFLPLSASGCKQSVKRLLRGVRTLSEDLHTNVCREEGGGAELGLTALSSPSLGCVATDGYPHPSLLGQCPQGTLESCVATDGYPQSSPMLGECPQGILKFVSPKTATHTVLSAGQCPQ